MSEPRTLCEGFQRTVATRGDTIALRAFDTGEELTWRDYGDRVRSIAGALAALGVRRGDTVATMLTNRIEFNLAETAASHLGATTYSVYNTSSPDQIAYVLTDAETRVVITERQFVDRIRDADRQVEYLLVVDDGDLDRLEATPDFDFEAAWRAVQPDDVACLIYTSGTTGPPKGVELTHTNLIALGKSITAVFPMGPGDRGVSYLPSSHIADRGIGHYYPMLYGCEVTCVAELKAISAALATVRPTFFVAVPRVWEKLKIGIEAQLEASPDTRSAFEAGNAQVAAGIRAKLGLDQLTWALSGAAAIPPSVYQFLSTLGIPISEVWGMSECGLGTGARPEAAKNGTIGPILPGMEAKLLDDGELLVRGANVMKGYRNAPEKTAAVDADGWLHTGDVATIDEDGYITLVDRKKELIINASGKNMSPSNIENAIGSASPLIGPVTVIGNGRPYNVALIVLDQDVTAAAGLGTDAKALAESDTVRQAVAAAVEAGNARLSRVEQVKKYTILSTFWEPGSDEVTPTMKLRRRQICAKYAHEIEEMYS